MVGVCFCRGTKVLEGGRGVDDKGILDKLAVRDVPRALVTEARGAVVEGSETNVGLSDSFSDAAPKMYGGKGALRKVVAGVN